ncbi:hypothetical protein [Serratia phage X20]|uniref:Uncharacterized protein n=3 Tax=Winklervirus TaxID=2560256 RepID=A0A1Z1LZ92_9CAUD|nr:hypothetical protein FDI23_gp269 [Serratia phage CHI14]YP_010092295.1 hypothetical protein KNT72_gp271 [Serratia phage X20]ARW57569.1 hypothetical protein [Serratia phage CHI14]ARW57844.1 hypothetical protein [Serratia phage CBH8]ARW58117.1 hypothetical protein [Serratia phage X20]
MYKLFLWDSYYPAGGLNDLEGEYDSIEEAMKPVEAKQNERYGCGGGYQIVDSSFKIIQKGYW